MLDDVAAGGGDAWIDAGSEAGRARLPAEGFAAATVSLTSI
jgi:hypothetical protein